MFIWSYFKMLSAALAPNEKFQMKNVSDRRIKEAAVT
jgi:hypothetical protein